MDLRHLDADALTHGRRAALRSAGLGLAALGALPLLTNGATAKKRGKKPGKVKDRCLPQVAACESVATTFCATAGDPALCREALFPCCQPLGACNGDQSIQCVIDAFTKKV